MTLSHVWRRGQWICLRWAVRQTEIADCLDTLIAFILHCGCSHRLRRRATTDSSDASDYWSYVFCYYICTKNSWRHNRTYCTHAHGRLNASVKLCHACFNSLFRLRVMQQTRMFHLSQVAFIFTVNNTKQLYMNKTGVM